MPLIKLLDHMHDGTLNSIKNLIKVNTPKKGHKLSALNKQNPKGTKLHLLSL